MPVDPPPCDADPCPIRMRDGVVLEGDLYRPTGPAPWPVLLARTPYERRSRFPPMLWQMDELREAGFAVLVQDMRGRGDSGGTARAFDVARERRDTVDTLDWIVRQSWAREGVGMFGASYCGYLQWVAASTGHPALRAIVPLDTSALLDHWLLDQGVLRAGWVLPWLAAFWSGAEIEMDAVDLDVRPASAVIRAATGQDAPELATWVRTGGAALPRIGPSAAVPALHAGGFHDLFRVGQLATWRTVGRGPGHRLSLDATDHWRIAVDGRRPTVLEALDEPSDAAFHSASIRAVSSATGQVDFLRAYVVDGRAPASSEPPVSYRLAHAEWRRDAAWPPTGSATRTLHLDAASGRLAERPAATAGALAIAHDPADPVRAVDDPFCPLASDGTTRGLDHAGVVTLVGEPASSPLDLAGPALIHGLGDLGDGMLVASLWDVAPDGSSDRIATATCLTGSRDVLALGDLGTRLRPGHRLELDLSASRAPAYPVHPGPGRDPWDGEAGPPSTHRLRTGGERGPRLELTTSPAARDGDG